MPLQAVEPRRLYRQIADQIAGLIGNGEFAYGSRLPAERELATLIRENSDEHWAAPAMLTLLSPLPRCRPRSTPRLPIAFVPARPAICGPRPDT